MIFQQCRSAMLTYKEFLEKDNEQDWGTRSMAHRDESLTKRRRQWTLDFAKHPSCPTYTTYTDIA